MASWMKEGRDVYTLLAEAARVDPDIEAALDLRNAVPFGSGVELMHAIADLCYQEVYDAAGDSVDQKVEIVQDNLTWTRKGKPAVYEGRRIYGEREPGFYLSISQTMEQFERGPKEWTPKKEALIYHFTLTVSREKGTKQMKRRAEELGWELVSG